MRWIKLLCALTILCLLGTCDLLEPVECEISVTITDWDQTYYQYLEEWSMTEIYYNVRNTGNTGVDYYKVYFKVTCSGGAVYYDWDNGLDVDVGRTISDWTIIDTAGKKVTSVRLDGTETDCY